MRIVKKTLIGTLGAMTINANENAVSLEDLCPYCYATHRIHQCGACDDCCRCSVCTICGDVSPIRKCESCAGCANCCACWSCARCKRTVKEERGICDICAKGIYCGCCAHQGSIDVERLRVRPKANLSRYESSTGVPAFPSSRLISAEIEICGFKNLTGTTVKALSKVMNEWNIAGVGDGSLPGGGIEFNTHPAANVYFIDQINDFCDALALSRAWINAQAGCHMHIDCRDLGYYSLAKTLRILGCVEAGLYAMIPAWRSTEERYCQYWATRYLYNLRETEKLFKSTYSPRKVTLLYRKAILSQLYGFINKAKIARVKAGKTPGAGNRYRGTNIHSFLHRGTIEFRMPAGTVFADNIINWGNVLSQIIDVAHNNSMADVIHLCEKVETKIMNGLWDINFASTPKAVVDDSFDLLKSIVTGQAVRDWMEERRKWARQHRIREQFTEGGN